VNERNIFFFKFLSKFSNDVLARHKNLSDWYEFGVKQQN